MDTTYSASLCLDLEKKFLSYGLHRPMKIGHYDEGRQLTYTMTTVDATANHFDVTLEIRRFAGGGFAGQVYQVRVLSVDPDLSTCIVPGKTYAMKIFIPPSGFSLAFRNLLYAVGFQGSFQLQCNPVAARCGALWQKFIRRAAELRFGEDASVNDIHATFIDTALGSCGELSDWVDGRTWRLEVDERMDLLSKWDKGKRVDTTRLGSPEYRAKKEFMKNFVSLLHEMGAHEFARQYEWSTWKSQPNCLKLLSTESSPQKGLVAVDFRAGLALLPFLPMSPGDVRLILQGLRRFSLVQFDRTDPGRLRRFVEKQRESFADQLPLLDELERSERIYRDSLPDITHNHIRLLFSTRLWSTILDSAVTGWRVRAIIDERFEKRLRKSVPLTVLFCLIGFIPFAGKILLKLAGNDAWRKHYVGLLTNASYFARALKGRRVESAIKWHRDGRLDESLARKVADSTALFILHLPFSVLPSGLHRLFTSWNYFKQRLDYTLLRPFRLYFNASLREKWLSDMVKEGLRKRILTEEDAREISAQLKEPFIQKYLQSLAVHVMTLPVTQLVSFTIAAIYVLTHPQLSWQEASATAVLIIGVFQVTPISPGSLVRGSYVLWLVIRERDFKNYNIAVILGFFKYIGYLAFPIQMTYRYPTIARFMACHWATDAVHIVPVFGESGALLEHKIFCLFYNWPLTIRRRMRLRAQMRQALSERLWHVVPLTLVSSSILYVVDRWYLRFNEKIAGLKELLSMTFSGIKRLITLLTSLHPPSMQGLLSLIHYVPFLFALMICGLCGAAVTLWSAGAPLNRRITFAASAGIISGGLYTVLSFIFYASGAEPLRFSQLIIDGVWKMFGYAIATTLGAIVTELCLPEPGRSSTTQSDVTSTHSGEV